MVKLIEQGDGLEVHSHKLASCYIRMKNKNLICKQYKDRILEEQLS